jgi:hypothetical protein
MTTLIAAWKVKWTSGGMKAEQVTRGCGGGDLDKHGGSGHGERSEVEYV